MTLWFVLERLQLKAVSLISMDFLKVCAQVGNLVLHNLRFGNNYLNRLQKSFPNVLEELICEQLTQRVGLSCNWIIHRRKA